MKIKLLVISLVLFNQMLLSQNLWQKLNGPPGGLIESVYIQGDTILAAGMNYKIFVSTDRGHQWKQYQFPYENNYSLGVELTLIHKNNIYAFTRYDGIFKSKDLILWQKLNYSASCYSLSQDNSGNIYAGSEDGKIYKSLDEGINWGAGFN